MVSSRQKLRKGEVVSLKDGRQAKLNLEDQTLELSDGKKLPVPERYKKEFFPSPERIPVVEEKERIRGKFENIPFGPALYQATETGAFKAGKGIYDKIVSTGDDYLKKRQAQQEVSEEISESNPYQSFAGTALGYAPDLALTRGMSALKAGPTLALAHAGPNIVEDPASVGASALVNTAAMKFIEAGGNFISKAAGRRGESRAVAAESSRVRASNKQGLAETNERIALLEQSHNVLKSDAQELNRLKKDQYELNVVQARQKIADQDREYYQKVAERNDQISQMKQDAILAKSNNKADWRKKQDEYEGAKREWEVEKGKIDKEHAAAVSSYEKELSSLPEKQNQLNKQYEDQVAKNVSKITESFPKGTKIYGSSLDPEGFIQNSIVESGLVATPAGKRATGIIRSIFKENDEFLSNQLVDKYRNLERRIVSSNKDVADILVDFKDHLAKQLPRSISDYIANKQLRPLINKEIGPIVSDAAKQLRESGGIVLSDEREKRLAHMLRMQMSMMGENGFIDSLKRGNIFKRLDNKIPIESFVNMTSDMIERRGPHYLNKVNEDYGKFLNILEDSLNSILTPYQKQANEIYNSYVKKLTPTAQRTRGTASSPIRPEEPVKREYPAGPEKLSKPIDVQQPLSFPPSISKPQDIPLPQKPSLTKIEGFEPMKFSPEVEPTLAPAMGAAEKMGDAFEQPILGNNPSGSIMKLAGLKYLMGGAAPVVEGIGAAGYAGMRGLTNPNVPGKLIFQNGGVMALQAAAEKYPSFHDGILEDPMERRSLVKEIEDDPTMPLEDKALYQSKVNRGKPLDGPSI
jgi:hypothetical protein